MSAVEETKREISVPPAKEAASVKAMGASETSLPARAVTLAVCVAVVAAVKLIAGDAVSNFDLGAMLLLSVVVAGLGVQRLMDTLSSVRFGVAQLILLVVACMIGMLVMQTNVDGFEAYYAALTPSQRLLGNFLNFFDIYHSRYFNLILLVLSLNIVLASIDRFPKAWTFISRRKLDASPKWLKGQEQSAAMEMSGESRASVAERIAVACRGVGMKTTVSEKNNQTFVFAERGAWNRLGAYAVHVALLTIFTGGFLTSQFGRTGQMWLSPGTTSSEMGEAVMKIDDATGEFAPTRANFDLPFQVTATDIQQKLIRKDGPITADNTLDWLTRVKIKDDLGEHEALIHMNRPHDYRGYRFFQASFQNLGHARNITLLLTPEGGGQPQELKIARDGAATLPDGTRVEFKDFHPDFTLSGSEPTTASGEYNNPAAVLAVTPASGGTPLRAYAFATELPAGMPVGAAKAGYKFKLADFEKVPSMHALSIQRDPGSTVVYVGFTMLALTLVAVFFFSHQRVWAHVAERSESDYVVTLGGNTNRNKLGFEDRFKRLIKAVGGESEAR